MKTYKLVSYQGQNVSVTMYAAGAFVAAIPFAPANTDYQAFKTALQTGKNADGTAVSLEDANGTAMTADQITTFLGTLP